MPRRNRSWLGAIVLGWAALMLLYAFACRGCAAAECNPVALAKARIIVAELYPDSGMYPWLGTLIAEHESYGDEDFAGAWYWSMVYGGANAKLKVGAKFPEGCSGPLDVKHYPRIMEPRAHIRHHVAEMWTGYGADYRGRGLCEYVMLPSAPRDWGSGMFRRTDARHRAVIERAYREGRIR